MGDFTAKKLYQARGISTVATKPTQCPLPDDRFRTILYYERSPMHDIRELRCLVRVTLTDLLGGSTVIKEPQDACLCVRHLFLLYNPKSPLTTVLP